jgi:hypothetical protein
LELKNFGLRLELGVGVVFVEMKGSGGRKGGIRGVEGWRDKEE